MIIFGKWKKHKFVVNHKKSYVFSDFSTKTEAKAKGSKSKKKKTELEEVSFVIHCVREAGVNPETEYAGWCKDINKSASLYIHGRKWASNPLKLKSVSLESVTQDDIGRMRMADIKLTFKEKNKKDVSTGSPSKAAKAAKKTAKAKKKKVTINSGSRVFLVGTYWADGQTIPKNYKSSPVTVGRLNKDRDKAFISECDAWVYTNTVSMKHK